MTIEQVQKKICRLKAETDTCILAHSYMTEDICEVADFVGDSYALAVKATKTDNKNVIMCGVRFMAEMVKMLNPVEKPDLAVRTKMKVKRAKRMAMSSPAGCAAL